MMSELEGLNDILNDGEMFTSIKNMEFVIECLRNNQNIPEEQRLLVQAYFSDFEKIEEAMRSLPELHLHVLNLYGSLQGYHLEVNKPNPEGIKRDERIEDRTWYEVQRVLLEAFDMLPATTRDYVVWRGIKTTLDPSHVGFISTSLSKPYAKTWAKKDLLKIHISAGTKIIPLFVLKQTGYEMEVLLSLNGSLRENFKTSEYTDVTFVPRTLLKRKRYVEWEEPASNERRYFKRIGIPSELEITTMTRRWMFPDAI